MTSDIRIFISTNKKLQDINYKRSFIIFVDFQSCSFSGFHYLTPVPWNAPTWINEDRGPLQQTPDFHQSIQDVIAQPAWNGTGPIIVALRNISSGGRYVYSFDGDPLKAPSLIIKYNKSKFNFASKLADYVIGYPQGRLGICG